MLVYNVKLIHYLHGTEVRIYSDLVGKSLIADLYKQRDIDKEKFNKDPIYYSDDDINPFTGLPVCEYKIFKDEDLKTKRDRGTGDQERSLTVSQNRTINKIYEITRSNDWEYFLTLTFDPDKVDSFDYDEVTKKLSQWIKNIKRKYAPDLKYILVPELHKSGRYHFHGLLKDIGELSLVDSKHKDQGGNIVYNLGNYKLGFSTVTKINDVSKTCSYISKYITKDLCKSTFGKKRYWISKNLNEPIIEDIFCNQIEKDDLLCLMNGHIQFSKTRECNGSYNLKVDYYQLDTDICFEGSDFNDERKNRQYVSM